MPAALETTYLRWTFARALCARGWWLATALYLVVVAELEPFQLVLIGTFQGAIVLVSEVPAGVLADAVSRRLALTLAQLISGAGMALAGMVESFPLLVVANCLWGMGWAFASGANVAWLTDELDEPRRIDRVLAAQGRWDLLGNPVGIAAAAALAWATSLSATMIVAGLGMAALGLVVARWPEEGFAPVDGGRSVAAATEVLRRGITLVRADRVVLAVLGANVVLNGGHEGYGRLRERRFVLLGMPDHPDPIVSFALLGLASVVVGVLALRVVERRIDRADAARRAHVASCLLAAVALLAFAYAPAIGVAALASVLVVGLGAIQRVTATIRVNRRTTSDARATVHSMLSWSENLGELIFGLTLALVAATLSASAALVGAAVLLVIAAAAAAVDD